MATHCSTINKSPKHQVKELIYVQQEEEDEIKMTV
jgi:hypothetical protein